MAKSSCGRISLATAPGYLPALTPSQALAPYVAEKKAVWKVPLPKKNYSRVKPVFLNDYAQWFGEGGEKRKNGIGKRQRSRKNELHQLNLAKTNPVYFFMDFPWFCITWYRSSTGWLRFTFCLFFATDGIVRSAWPQKKMISSSPSGPEAGRERWGAHW